MSFSPNALYACLSDTPARRYLVAYSGGLDSTVLLHALATLRAQLAPVEIAALHVDHGLHAQSAQWAETCSSRCAALDIPCSVLRVHARPRKGESPEAAARQARYSALAARLAAGDVLLTAQHCDDQAETVLLQLLRGSGPRGLAAMPVSAALGAGLLLRPLLAFDRAELLRYACAQQLEWIEDHSNADIGFDRNYLRHEVMPRIFTRWPSVSRTLARSARHCADAAALICEVAEKDLAAARDEAGGGLAISRLARLAPERQRQVLRTWIEGSGLPLPDSVQLARIFSDVIASRRDATPVLCWPGAELRRYRDSLYLMPPQPIFDMQQIHSWQAWAPLVIEGLGVLSAHATHGEGLSVRALQQAPLSVRFRRGGERCHPFGRGHSHALKKLMQEAGIPPWRRERIPLLYSGEVIASVVGLWVCEGFQAGLGEPAVNLLWQEVAVKPPHGLAKAADGPDMIP